MIPIEELYPSDLEAEIYREMELWDMEKLIKEFPEEARDILNKLDNQEKDHATTATKTN